MIENLPANTYIIKVKVYYLDWNFVCAIEESVEIVATLIVPNTAITFQPTTTAAISNFSIAPNPAKDFIQLGLIDFMDEEVEVVIYNVLGEIAFKQYFNQLTQAQLRINTQDFNSGLHIVAISHNGQVTSKKFMRLAQY